MQVAMLFLSMGELRHETLWSQWFKLGQGHVPLDCFQAEICSGSPVLPANLSGLIRFLLIQLLLF